MLLPSPTAMRCTTSTLGVFSPRSTAESMLRLTPQRSAASSSESPCMLRSDRMRAPVVDVSIISIDYVRDSMELDVRFVEHPSGLPRHSEPWPAPELVRAP